MGVVLCCIGLCRSSDERRLLGLFGGFSFVHSSHLERPLLFCVWPGFASRTRSMGSFDDRRFLFLWEVGGGSMELSPFQCSAEDQLILWGAFLALVHHARPASDGLHFPPVNGSGNMEGRVPLRSPPPPVCLGCGCFQSPSPQRISVFVSAFTARTYIQWARPPVCVRLFGS